MHTDRADRREEESGRQSMGKLVWSVSKQVLLTDHCSLNIFTGAVHSSFSCSLLDFQQLLFFTISYFLDRLYDSLCALISHRIKRNIVFLQQSSKCLPVCTQQAKPNSVPLGCVAHFCQMPSNLFSLIQQVQSSPVCTGSITCFNMTVPMCTKPDP